MFETIAFAFSIMGVVASVSSSLEFPLVAGEYSTYFTRFEITNHSH